MLEEPETCDQCGGEGGYHDCGDDCCLCADPEPNVVCDVCGGNGEVMKPMFDEDVPQ